MPAAYDLLVPVELEILSPELALVDSRLSLQARTLLGEPGEAIAQIARTATPPLGRELESGTNVDPASSAEEDVAAALRRITELSEVVPPKPRRRRLLPLVALAGTSSAVGLLVLDLQLGLYQWPF